MLVAVGRYGHEDLARPDVTTRGVWLTLAFDRLRLGCLPSCDSRLGTVIWFGHAHAPWFGQLAKPRKKSTLLIGIDQRGDLVVTTVWGTELGTTLLTGLT